MAKIINRITRGIIAEDPKMSLRNLAIESKADLSRADLFEAVLCNTKFENTRISYRDKFVEVNFKEVK